MSRVFKRGDKWGIDYVANGIRRREIVGDNKAIALKALQKKQVLIAENRFLDVKRQPKMKVCELTEKYTELYLKQNRANWEKAEKNNLRHINNFMGDKYIHELTPVDVEKFRLERLQVVSKSSVNKNVGCLRAMFNKAIEWKLFEGVNPVKGIRFYKLDNRRLRYLEKSEIQRLLGHCEGHLKDIVEFAINTGMRKGEIFNLKWHDIDWNNGLVHLLQTKNHEKREIPINENVRNVLIRVKRNLDSPYVFNSFNGKPFNDIKKSFYTALDKSGIDNFRFHDLRHTFASQLVMSGVDLLTIKELLGHKRMEMTLRYSHLSCDHKKRAVKSLDSINGTKLAQTLPNEILSDGISIVYKDLESV